MGGRAVGVGPILFGIYLLHSNLSKSTLFVQGPEAPIHTTFSALGAFLLILGVIFLYKNLR